MAEMATTLQKTVEVLASEQKYATIRDILITMNAADVAALLQQSESTRLPVLFRLLPKELAAETFVEMQPEDQELLIRGFSDTELRAVINELFVDDAVDLVEEMPANVVRRILAQADPEMRQQINELLKYPEDSAGSIMTTEYVSLRPDMRVEDAIARIRATGVDKETIYTCYVTEGRFLRGIVTAKALLLSDGQRLIRDLMEDHVISVRTDTDQEEVAQQLRKYGFLALPVVDNEDRLVGIVTVDDAMDVIQEEATEDIEIMAAITPSEKPYLRTSVVDIFLHRIPWLLLLMISATFTGIIITRFEDALAVQVALVGFIPMLMDTGGNSGSQARVTISRGLSLQEIAFRDLPRVLWKEIRVAVLCGVVLAVACFGKIMLVDRLLMHNLDVTIPVALTVCLTLALTILCAKAVGCTLPMLAQKLGFDPAVMANPAITNLVDALSLLTYFSVATFLLHL